MKLLIFDTETTGLPVNRNILAINGPNNWPHIVSISWVILDVETNKIESKKSFVVQPLGWTIPPDSTKIHGISHDFALNNGTPLTAVMTEFTRQKYDCLVAHNMDFDFNVLMNAYRWDLGVMVNDTQYRRKCTMKLSVDLCRLPGQWGNNRWPKLSELYEFAFNRKPVQASLHNSIYDTLILAEIVQHCDELRNKMGLPVKPTFVNNGTNNKILSI
jgi:DNA polymerase III epsilon subunit-like protein